MSQVRTADHPIDPQFTDRWSPRSLTGEPLPDATLRSFFEAARWAPSAYNAQPWRFLYVHRDNAQWQTFVDLLLPANRIWAERASALVLLVSKTTLVPPGADEAQPSGSHAFDAGAAWAQFALQASLSGWACHAMAGFDRERARRELAVPEDYALQIMIAVGKRGDPTVLPERLQALEAPNARKPLADLVFEGAFPAV